jgi:hypothetical protein
MRGLDCNDRLPALARDGDLLEPAPAPAYARGRGNEPALEPIVSALRAAALPEGASLWISVPSRMAPDSMGDLLRQLRAMGVSVQGFVDAAVVTAAWLQKPAPVVVLDIGLHGAVFSVVTRDGDTCRLRRSASLPTGTEDLLQQWVGLAGQSMVRQTRFDPLHDQRHEAQVRAALPAMLRAAENDGAATLSLQAEGRDLTVSLSRDQFVAAAAGALQPFTETLQALCAALGDCHVMVPEALVEWPGLAEALGAAGSRPVWAVAEGCAARAASLLPATGGEAGGAVQYLTQLAPMGMPAPEECSRLLATRGGVATAATHLVFRGRAIPIGARGIVLGRDPGEGAGHIVLPEGIAGVSRRHCTLHRAGDETVLVDHSRYGTFVDGQRVNGRTLLSAGSNLRLGTPGIELPLVAIGEARI